MADDLSHVFRVRRPCTSCPFAATTPGFLHRERAEEIARDCLHGDQPFHCHKTLNESGEGSRSDGASTCAGFLLVLDRDRGLGANLSVRLALMLGLLDPQRLDRRADVYANAEAFVVGHGQLGRDS